MGIGKFGLTREYHFVDFGIGFEGLGVEESEVFELSGAKEAECNSDGNEEDECAESYTDGGGID